MRHWTFRGRICSATKNALLICFSSILLPLPVFAGTFMAFGPQSYIRELGSPVAVIQSFAVLNPNTAYTLRINNGGLTDGEFEKVSSSVFILNGVQVVGPSEFNQNVSVVEKPVTLGTINELSVEVGGKPGGSLAVQIIGVDNDPPTITASVNPLPNAAGWHNQGVTVSFTCNDATSGIATCPGPVTVTTEGANQFIAGTATDRAGNSATTSVTLSIDKTPPVISLTAPSASFATNKPVLTVTGTVTDANAITQVAVNGTPVSFTNGGFGQDVTLSEGTHSLTVTALDIAGNSASLSRSVTLDTIPPQVAITAPANLSTLSTQAMTVTGTVDDPQATVTVQWHSCSGEQWHLHSQSYPG